MAVPTALQNLKLKMLEAQQSYFDTSGRPTIQMQIFWQQTATALMDVITALVESDANQDDLLDQILAAQNSADALMPDIPPVTIASDYTGTIISGQLPYNVLCQRFNNTTDVTASSSWSMTVESGTITASIGASTGVVTITALSSNAAVMVVTSVHGGITRSRKLVVSKSTGAAPTGGSGGGSSATDTTFSNFNSTTHAAVSDELTVTAGSAGIVTLSASLTVRMTPKAEGTFPVLAKWEWWDGAAWVEVAAEVESDPDCTVEEDAETGVLSYNPEGTLTVNTSKTGLVAASSHKFRVVARNSSGTRTMTLSGTASAVGS
jgi:hypothetical protein